MIQATIAGSSNRASLRQALVLLGRWWPTALAPAVTRFFCYRSLRFADTRRGSSRGASFHDPLPWLPWRRGALWYLVQEVLGCFLEYRSTHLPRASQTDGGQKLCAPGYCSNVIISSVSRSPPVTETILQGGSTFPGAHRLVAPSHRAVSSRFRGILLPGGHILEGLPFCLSGRLTNESAACGRRLP